MTDPQLPRPASPLAGVFFGEIMENRIVISWDESAGKWIASQWVENKMIAGTHGPTIIEAFEKLVDNIVFASMNNERWKYGHIIGKIEAD
jgi:hypothetical protein